MSKMLGSARGYSLVAACLCLIAVQARAQSEDTARTAGKSVALETSAIQRVQPAVSLDPKFAKAHVGLGDAYARSGRTKLAIDAYKKGAQTCPEDADAPFYLGMLYWRQDRYLEAIDAFNEAIKRDSQRYMAYVGIGRSYAGLRRYPEAVGPLKEAVKIKPDSLDAHLELGETYLKLGDKAAAMNEYRMLKGISAFMAEQFLQKIKMLD